ncbi:DoxX family protein [Citrobacter meridianamericanus]|uniref:DoxX family protein n=1 Tax=Citrobacter meridianamericanus TaxID=2894201 RepID=UPI0039BE2825
MLKIIMDILHFGRYLVKTVVTGILARTGLAATFWLSGQSKVEGLQIDLHGDSPLQLDFPEVTTGAIDLFREEYHVPLISPELAATLAACAEHVFPALLILGLATRFSALALMVMTLIIQIFVYPDAWPVHATWMAALLYLMTYGSGTLSLDYLMSRKR